jgi:hypothetical protein
VTSTLNEELKDGSEEGVIIGALENVCILFAQKDHAKCDTFLEQYSNELVHVLI